jgi:hypothetical protein
MTFILKNLPKKEQPLSSSKQSKQVPPELSFPPQIFGTLLNFSSDMLKRQREGPDGLPNSTEIIREVVDSWNSKYDLTSDEHPFSIYRRLIEECWDSEKVLLRYLFLTAS